MADRPRAAFFSMPEAGHFQRLRPLISGLAECGIEAHVFTDRRFEAGVLDAGGRFVDLFDRYPIEGADDESTPVPCRYVSFAGTYASRVIEDVAALGPSLVVYDTFAAIGPVVGRALGVPYVNVCAGHDMDPAWIAELVSNHPRVWISERCHRAVETLRDRYGVSDASPFSYLTGLSPYLNLHCEPAEFFDEARRGAFEPVAFYGSLPSIEQMAAREKARGPSPFTEPAELEVYVSFGTVVWRYWPAEARDALSSISVALAGMPEARAVISLGGAALAADSRREVERANVTVVDHVDQWRALQEADAFITHQGLNSTHEAIFNLVPMISYPFFTDQPSLARRCIELGVAIPLTEAVREPVSPEAVQDALGELGRRREPLLERLTEAREWERRVIADRGAVLDRIAALIGE